MRISFVEAVAVSRPRVSPVRDAIQLLDTHGECRITVETSDGMSGHASISFGRLDGAPAVLAQLVNDELAQAVIGQDPFYVRAIRDRLWEVTDYHGTVGLSLMGIAGIDIALWDLLEQFELW